MHPLKKKKKKTTLLAQARVFSMGKIPAGVSLALLQQKDLCSPPERHYFTQGLLTIYLATQSFFFCYLKILLATTTAPLIWNGINLMRCSLQSPEKFYLKVIHAAVCMHTSTQSFVYEHKNKPCPCLTITRNSLHHIQCRVNAT